MAKKNTGSPLGQLTGTFPVNLGRDSNKRLNPKKVTKGYSSLAQPAGKFPVDFAPDKNKRFTPKAP